MREMMTPADIASAVQLACLLEVAAPKPGNVSPSRAFGDTRFEDFLASAAAIGPAFLNADREGLGTTVLCAVEATRRWTTANTNLGLILLLAPLAHGLLRQGEGSLRDAVRKVLDGTTVEDARQVFQAIRTARPGGLGSVGEQDVAREPSVTLLEAMRLAAARDAIASEYATGFAITFEQGAPTLSAALDAGLEWPSAAVETSLHLLARQRDTLIERKLGRDAADAISRDAAEVLVSGGVRTAEGRARLERFDAGLRDEGNQRNPGTTADLTAAALLVVIIERGLRVG
jgi:triphosphoribosyl-dephospho-CoA synthase